MKNKEYGSDFHYLYDVDYSTSSIFDDTRFSFFFSGRVALYNLLKWGIEKYKWSKVGFPSYYCHEVVDFCKNLDIEVVYYNTNPLDSDQIPEWDDNPKNVFINVDFFGIKKLNTSFLVNSVVIDDVTHNLLSTTESNADYCFASLRKQLPLAVGGFCFSPKNDCKSEIEETQFANKLAVQKLSAMFLKSLYLKGNLPEKETFRGLFIEAEQGFESHQSNSKLPEIIKTQLFSLNAEKLIEITRRNILSLQKQIRSSNKIKVCKSEKSTEMGLIFKCETNELREEMRRYLINNNIYPAVLWPKQFSSENIHLENTILFVHCDFRYNNEDMEHIAFIINNYIDNV